MCDPKTGHISKNFNQYNDQVGRLRKAVPKMILQLVRARRRAFLVEETY